MFIPMTEAEIEAEVAADVHARGLDPNDAADRKVFLAETDAMMTELMSRAGLNRDSVADCEEMSAGWSSASFRGAAKP